MLVPVLARQRRTAARRIAGVLSSRGLQVACRCPGGCDVVNMDDDLARARWPAIRDHAGLKPAAYRFGVHMPQLGGLS